MITGHFTTLEVPPVVIGKDIKATIGFYAINPGALYWRTYLVAVSGDRKIERMLETTREIGEEGHRTKTYTVGKMPGYEIAITFCLFAHANPLYAWDWADYILWEASLPNPTGAQCLDYDIVFLSPGTPEEGEFRNLSVSYKRA